MPRRLILDGLSARFGGAAYASVQIARRWAADPAVDEVVVLTRAGSLIDEGLAETPGLRVLRLPATERAELARRLGWQAARLPSVTAPADPLLTWSGMLPRRPSGRVVSYLANPPVFEDLTPRNAIRRRAIARTAAYAVLAAPSRAMADMAERALGKPVHAVAHGVDHERFRPAAPGTEILYVGDAYGHKRHDVALAAWAALPEPRPVLRLIADLRVEPATGERLRAAVERHRALGTVVLTGGLSDAEVEAAYASARLLLLTSERESFAMPLLEALAAGVPAVARDLRALRETGGPGTAYVAGDDPGPWAAAMTRLLHDDGAHAQARAAGVAHAAGYSWERSARELRDLLVAA